MKRPSVKASDLSPDVLDRVKASGALALVSADTPTDRQLKRERNKAKAEERVRRFFEYLRAAGVEEPVRELEFAQPAAGWRFDFAWPDRRLALEADGGAFLKGGAGRHGSGAGFREDVAKRNAAALMGWKVIHVLSDELPRSDTAELIRMALSLASGYRYGPHELPRSILDARQSARRARRKPPAAFVAARKGKGKPKP